MSQTIAQLRRLRHDAAGGGSSYGLAAPANGPILPVEVTAVDLGAEPPLHTVAGLNSANVITDLVISRVQLIGGGSVAVGTRMACVQLANGRWMLLAGAGGSGSGATGAILPHSHLGGADGPIIGILG